MVVMAGVESRKWTVHHHREAVCRLFAIYDGHQLFIIVNHGRMNPIHTHTRTFTVNRSLYDDAFTLRIILGRIAQRVWMCIYIYVVCGLDLVVIFVFTAALYRVWWRISRASCTAASVCVELSQYRERMWIPLQSAINHSLLLYCIDGCMACGIFNIKSIGAIFISFCAALLSHLSGHQRTPLLQPFCSTS